MPTVRTVTVKTSGGDYTSLSGAEGLEQGDLVTLDRQVNIECYAMSDTATVTFDSWITDATRYIRVYTPSGERHDGKWNTGKYRLEVTDNYPIICYEDYIRFDGLQIKLSNSTGTYPGIRVQTGGASDVRITNCLITAVNTGTGAGYGIAIYTTLSVVHVHNCIIWDWNGGTSIAIYVDNCAPGSTIYNVTMHNCDIGILSFASSDPLLKNCLTKSCTDGYSGTFHASSTNNASDVASDAPGSNPYTGGAIFVNEGADDFHLSGSDTVAGGHGVDLSADSLDPFSDDIDGVARSDGLWDIGADEYVAAGGGPTVAQMIASMIHPLFSGQMTGLVYKRVQTALGCRDDSGGQPELMAERQLGRVVHG